MLPIALRGLISIQSPGGESPLAVWCSAVINRFGFNSSGVDAVGSNLSEFRKRAAADPRRAPGLVGVNLGKNKSSEDAADDYSLGAQKLGKHADYLVINVSSPNTPGMCLPHCRGTSSMG